MSPSLLEVISFIREHAALRKQHIDENTYIEEDLHITGDDGVELLEEAEKVFGVCFETEDHNLATLFSMKDNEYLFTSEGFDPFGIFRFFEWLRGIPGSTVRDLTVGELHQVLVKLRLQQKANTGER
ncbi:DUF1493 family protein [Brenneria izadpanahii]|uniref:DUF1493 family protein n=2 Tax=Brenneria izadpanahii TaxID=2722756 RepID=A0ABX7UYR9_9GAMM|nr:DUF1493 family protein [Brenneria izadpanahii]QTF10913.1 DUF1493 family protein [Brenneria izadpanahii]